MELIYSQFDIVWPDDEGEPDETRTGVDALTFGLSTLALAEEVFEPADKHGDNHDPFTCSQCGHVNHMQSADSNGEDQRDKIAKYRLGNYYARYIKRLSIGNGPPQFIKDYAADKEPGKMLNTLVALAVGRCKNLEDFKWDMPTGITREVWLALASLKNHSRGGRSPLRKLWVRYVPLASKHAKMAEPCDRFRTNQYFYRIHDRRLAAYEPYPNARRSSIPPLPPGSSSPPIVIAPPITTHGPAAPFPSYLIPPTPEMQTKDRPTSIKNVSFPHRTFSILSPLEKLCVLGVDAPQYLFEISELIGRSMHCLKELRISLLETLPTRHKDWKEVWEGEDAPDPYEAFKMSTAPRTHKRAGGVMGILMGRFFSVKEYERALEFTNETHSSMDTSTVNERLSKLNDGFQTVSIRAQPRPAGDTKPPSEFHIVNKKLVLDALMMSHFPLSIPTLSGALDWSRLTRLTVLSCPLSDNLWAMLRRVYTPKAPADGSCYVQLQYPLALRGIRTDAVSPGFVKFLSETLAPNTVQSLFLNDNPRSKRRHGKVSIKQLFKGAIRRHGNSLEKLSIDSTVRKRNGFLDSKDDSSQYQQWLVNRDALQYITSGAMHKLRQICLSVPYTDWHYFVRRLVRIPSLQVLYIPVLHHEGHLQNSRKSDPEDLANQIADAIFLRPEIGISYFANHNRCFEIHESKPATSTDAAENENTPNDWMQGPSDDTSDHNDSDVEIIDDDPISDSNDDTSTDDEDDDTDDENAAGEGWGADTSDDKEKIVYNVKEILFPDEKAEIFKARKTEL